MLRYPLSTNQSEYLLRINYRILTALKWFWQFSNFYGDYNSLAPKDRRRFIQEQEKASQNRQSSLNK